MKEIHQTTNGRLKYCEGCGHYHLEFGNIFMNLTQTQLQSFTNYVEKVDVAHYLELNKNACNNRKLMLQIGQCGAYFCVNPEELYELRELLGKRNVRVLPNNLFIAKELMSN